MKKLFFFLLSISIITSWLTTVVSGNLIGPKPDNKKNFVVSSFNIT
ncbi:hypothetical protein [Spiroplasma endosymbiont of Cantharis nigra]